MSRRTWSALAAAALLTPLLAATTGPAAEADDTTAPTSSSPVKVLAPRHTRVPAYDGRVYLDSVATLVAQNEPFEIRATRPSYASSVVGFWRRSSGDVALPADSMRTLSGLNAFARVSVRTTAGTPLREFAVRGCFNGARQRLRPDAQAHRTYPEMCSANAYALGTVMGIEEGWGLPLGGYRSLKLSPGAYDVVVSITPRWRDFFGISEADGTSVTRMRVVTGTYRSPATARTTTLLRPAAQEPGRHAGGSSDGPRPDLRSLPAWDVSLNPNGRWLRFAANVWNGGDSPLVVDGYRGPDDEHMDAYQYFFDTDGNQLGYQQVGEMHFHAANHNHWHFEDFARYRLLDANKQPVGRSNKQSFCLAATDAVDYTLPAADWFPQNTDLGTACGGPSALAVRQSLPVGSGDTYAQFRAGQAIRVDGLPNGIYYLAVEANPSGRLIESDTTNNVALRRIRLGGTPTKRWVRVPQVGVIVDPVTQQ